MENKKINIPNRFYKEIVTHTIANFIVGKQQSDSLKLNIPLLLGIHGKSGQGKTYQIEQTLNYLEFETFHISGSQLESEKAGEPAKLIKETYIKAGRFATNNNKGAAILIDDIDAGFGMWGDMYQYTVNTQIVIATLMHLADNPHIIDNQTVARVPIILTGNDFTKIYEPISRPGRMRSFIWEPNKLEKLEILKPIFPLLDDIEIQQLVETFPESPVSFFTNLSAYILQEKIWNLYQSRSKEVMDNLKIGRIPKIEYHCLLNELLEVGHSILRNSNFVNHLKR